MNRDPQHSRRRLVLQSALVEHTRFKRRRLLTVLKWAGAVLALAAGIYTLGRL